MDISINGEFSTTKKSRYGWIWIWPNGVEWSGTRNFAPWRALVLAASLTSRITWRHPADNSPNWALVVPVRSRVCCIMGGCRNLVRKSVKRLLKIVLRNQKITFYTFLQSYMTIDQWAKLFWILHIEGTTSCRFAIEIHHSAKQFTDPSLHLVIERNLR